MNLQFYKWSYILNNLIIHYAIPFFTYEKLKQN